MRERVLRIVTTSVTLFMLFVGWIVQKNNPPRIVRNNFPQLYHYRFLDRQSSNPARHTKRVHNDA
jgi:hypothetical protein